MHLVRFFFRNHRPDRNYNLYLLSGQCVHAWLHRKHAQQNAERTINNVELSYCVYILRTIKSVAILLTLLMVY